MKALLATLALSAVALAGCSGGGDDGCGTQDDEGRYVVCLTSDLTFEPKTLEVPVGSTVVWELRGGAPHNVVAHDGSFESAFLTKKGDQFEHTFDTAGEYGYHCDPHETQDMTGTIIVTA